MIYIEPSMSFAEAMANWNLALTDWITVHHKISPLATLLPAYITPDLNLAALFQANHSLTTPTGGAIISADITAHILSKTMLDMATVNAGWSFVFVPSTVLDLTSSTKEGMFDIFSAWLTSGALAATNSGGTTFPCVFQRT